MDPRNAEDWLEVAKERAADTDSVAKSRPASVGPVYLAGYVVECTLKAYLCKSGVRRPPSGRAGHNLRELWDAAGFRLADLPNRGEHAGFFVNSWSTSLRYETSLHSTGQTSAELILAAKQMSGWIRTRMLRDRKRR